jgi:serine/threonine protein kinase
MAPFRRCGDWFGSGGGAIIPSVVEHAVVRRVGRYEVVREVGRGGMAVVYLARQPDLDRDVALKELAAFHASDPAFVARFLRESRLTGSLNHPNIVTVHEYFEHDGTAYIAMEYFERGSLRPLVGQLSLAQIAGVLEGLLAALAHAEPRGIVHRDLKPENVMVTADGAVKIADFGIAKALGAAPVKAITETGTTVGTPGYMAPEQAMGGEVGPETDLYALGVMAYELLAGRPPYEADLPLAFLLQHLNEPVPPLRSLKPELDPRLTAWVERLLAKAPEERPGSAREAWEELEEIAIAGLGARWRREGRLAENGTPLGGRPTPLLPAAAFAGAPDELVPTVPRRPRRSRRRVQALAALLVAGAVGGIVAGLVLPGNGREGTTAPSTPTTRFVPPDLVPAPSERISLVASRSAVFVADPKGRILELDPTSLRLRTLHRDPAGPRSLALRGGSLLVADGAGVTAFRAGDLRPERATSLPGVVALAGGSGSPLFVARIAGPRRGRLCALGVDLATGPCARLGFAPSGLGASGQLAVVADGRAGAVSVFRLVPGRLVEAGAPIAVGSAPGGPLVVADGRVFVPVRRGIAVVGLSARSVRRIPLPVSPAGLWLASSGGRLLAALPGLHRVALVDLSRLDRAPLFVSTLREPVSLAGAAGAVVVADGRFGTLTRLDPRTGVQRSPEVAALGGPTVKRLILRGVGVRDDAAALSVTLALAGSGLDPTGLIVRDRDIADGQAALELWQGGIGSRLARRAFAGLALRIRTAPGRLVIDLSAPAGSFIGLEARRTTPHTIRLVLTKARPVQTPGSTITRTSVGHAGTPTTPKTTVKKKPPPPPPPCCDVG